MYNRLPGCGNFHCFGLFSDMDLAAIPKKIYNAQLKTSWGGGRINVIYLMRETRRYCLNQYAKMQWEIRKMNPRKKDCSRGRLKYILRKPPMGWWKWIL